MLLVLHDAAGLVDSVFTESHSFFFFFLLRGELKNLTIKEE